MREYILYVLLFFIPIGAAMVAFLKREGLANKNINVVVAVSFFIIITFPVGMEKLGSLLALSLYLIVVFITAGWLFKDRNAEFMQLGREKSGTESAATFMAATNLMEKLNSEPEVPSELGAYIGYAPGEGNATENEAQMVSNLQAIPEAMREHSDGIQGMEEPAAALNSPPEAMGEAGEDAFQEEVAALAPLDMPGAVETPALPEVLEEEAAEVGIIVPEEELPIPAEQNDNPVPSEDEGDLVPETPDRETDTVEDYAPITPTGFDEQVRVQHNVAIRSEESVSAGEDVRVMENINNGFNLKEQGRFQEAAACFFVSWDRTRDEELKYLLTLELIELYKDTGQYSDALRIIERFLEMRGHKFDIINKIKRQKEFLSVLTQELSRLGLDGTPISSVPQSALAQAERAVTPHSLAKGEVRT